MWRSRWRGEGRRGPRPFSNAFSCPWPRADGSIIRLAGPRFDVMDDRRAALFLALLAAGGAVARFALAPRPGAAPGEVRLAPGASPPPPSRSVLAQNAGAAEIGRAHV